MSRPDSSSTQSKGNVKWDTCWRHAAYLSAFMYKNPPPTGGFHTRHPDRIDEVEDHWEQWEEVNQQSGNGMKLVSMMIMLAT